MTMEQPKKPTKEEAEAATSVFWDINRCPVPSDVDPRWVGPCIKRALRNLGYKGPITIAAIGILTEVPPDVLRTLCATGIGLNHVPTDIKGICVELCCWHFRNIRRANIMLISAEPSFGGELSSLELVGYNVIRSLFPVEALSASFPTTGLAEHFFIWKSLEPRLRKEVFEEEEEDEDEDCEPPFVCSTCVAGKGDIHQQFHSFMTHLDSKEHALQELQYFPFGSETARCCHDVDASTLKTILRGFQEEEEEEGKEYEYKKQRTYEYKRQTTSRRRKRQRTSRRRRGPYIAN